MPAQQQWLQTTWPLVRSYLPAPPARVVELGCGRLGGFVPMLGEDGYDAIGIDPAAPAGECFRQVPFEQVELAGEVDSIIACTSLHHVADPDQVLDRIVRALSPDGLVVVIEWDWESFDEASAGWCFERLGDSDTDSWIHRRRQQWIASGEPWQECFFGWARQHGLHSARGLVRALDARFERVTYRRGPYFFAELADVTERDELSAIEAGAIQPARIDYVGRARAGAAGPANLQT